MITGLFDAESSFVVTILKNSRYKTGWNVQARIQLKMHENDRALIQSIQDFFHPLPLFDSLLLPPGGGEKRKGIR